MNSKEVFVNLSQIVGIDRNDFPLPEEYERELSFCFAYNTTNTLSHVTAEFRGMTAKFFSCMIFDGTGAMGIGVSGFAMPKMKINVIQKALALLTILEYMIESGLLFNAPFEFFLSRVELELAQQGHGGVIQRYKHISKLSSDYILSQQKGSKITPHLANVR